MWNITTDCMCRRTWEVEPRPPRTMKKECIPGWSRVGYCSGRYMSMVDESNPTLAVLKTSN